MHADTEKFSTKEDIFAKYSVPKAIATLAIPTIISQLINLIYNMVDTIYIGMTGDAYKTAAVTLVFTIFIMTISFANLFGIGGGSLIARLIGANKQADAKRVCAFSFYAALGSALLYSLFIAVFMNPILTVLGASDYTMTFAKQYVWVVVVLGNVPVIVSMTCAHLMRNAGYAKQASIGLSGGGILNIILDPLFMFVLLPKGMEVLGAAIATLLSNIISFIYMIYIIHTLTTFAPLSLNWQDAKSINKQEIKGVFNVGVPSGVLTGLFDVANIFLNALMSGHGDLQLAAIGIVMKAERLPNAINVGICQGMLPLVAYNYTAHNWDRMNKIISTVRGYGLIIAGLSLIMFQFFSHSIVHVFLSTEGATREEAIATIAYAAVFLQIRSMASIPQFLNYHTSFCLQAVGDGRDTFIHAVARELVFFIPFMFILNNFFGAKGLAAALPISECWGAVFVLFLLHGWKKRNIIGKDTGE